MTHIYDWLEMPSKSIEEEKVREFLDFKTRPAYYQMENKPPKLKVFCHFDGKKYKITGASTMGDVWLAKDYNGTKGYDLRVSIAGCSKFEFEDIK
ncbi:hypothetical protein HOK00_04205 [bacterium]|mgnify:CR=1 FL=1|jgi:hypothetical protein|nr:hypothetical protein [bacterium]